MKTEVKVTVVTWTPVSGATQYSWKVEKEVVIIASELTEKTDVDLIDLIKLGKLVSDNVYRFYAEAKNEKGEILDTGSLEFKVVNGELVKEESLPSLPAPGGDPLDLSPVTPENFRIEGSTFLWDAIGVISSAYKIVESDGTQVYAMDIPGNRFEVTRNVLDKINEHKTYVAMVRVNNGADYGPEVSLKFHRVGKELKMGEAPAKPAPAPQPTPAPAPTAPPIIPAVPPGAVPPRLKKSIEEEIEEIRNRLAQLEKKFPEMSAEIEKLRNGLDKKADKTELLALSAMIMGMGEESRTGFSKMMEKIEGLKKSAEASANTGPSYPPAPTTQPAAQNPAAQNPSDAPAQTQTAQAAAATPQNQPTPAATQTTAQAATPPTNVRANRIMDWLMKIGGVILLILLVLALVALAPYVKNWFAKAVQTAKTSQVVTDATGTPIAAPTAREDELRVANIMLKEALVACTNTMRSGATHVQMVPGSLANFGDHSFNHSTINLGVPVKPAKAAAPQKECTPPPTPAQTAPAQPQTEFVPPEPRNSFGSGGPAPMQHPMGNWFGQYSYYAPSGRGGAWTSPSVQVWVSPQSHAGWRHCH